MHTRLVLVLPVAVTCRSKVAKALENEKIDENDALQLFVRSISRMRLSNGMFNSADWCHRSDGR